MKFMTSEWLKSSEADLATIEEILKNPDLSHVVAFHAHQAVEKCFKAILEEHTVELEKIHNLIKLFDKVGRYYNREIDMDMLDVLNGLYIDSRYPGAMGFLPGGRPDPIAARGFYEFAKGVYESVRLSLEGRG